MFRPRESLPGQPAAVLHLKGLEDVPARALFEVVERVRRALGLLGISQVRVEMDAREAPPSDLQNEIVPVERS